MLRLSPFFPVSSLLSQRHVQCFFNVVSSWKADLHRILLPGCSIDFPTNGDRIASRVRSCRAYYEVDTRFSGYSLGRVTYPGDSHYL
ncbi:uncharacterized protein LOC107272384 isoform X4 [Cephus cinctus]|uniref:Uncharacterized protein LOC107272384 isoform X4 n=1 Tax=Cephus cinctus TaxID=211228 RepID=A0AAJ7RS59_CEPCN|nr:uncharacterized protein LOC107272384 isoform X4 [Cephus cinctus]